MDFTPLEAAIIYEDELLVVINKPAGWVVNRSDSYHEPTVQDWAESKFSIPNFKFSKEDETPGEFGSRKEIFLDRGGIVHRLDKDTSGILVLAKTPKVLVEMLRQFREREVSKTYEALIHGKLAPDEGIIRLPMARSDHDYKKFAVSADGRLSETHYKVIEFFPGLPKGMSEKKGKSYQGFTLLDLMPKTGRTHQIRVHMAALKHPIVGDQTYAGRKRIVLDQEWCPRQFLHAKTIEFVHPISQKPMRFEAPLPEDLKKVLEFLA